MSTATLKFLIEADATKGTATVKKFTGDLDGMGKAADKSGSMGATASEKFSGALVKIGGILAGMAIVSKLTSIGKASIAMAVDAVESENLFTVSMGNMADAAYKWSVETSKALGLNQYEVRKSIGTFNVMLGSMGLGADAAYDMAKGMTQLSYDMASFYNLKPEEAFQKLQAGISGETEPLKRLGILINETTDKAHAYKVGIAAVGSQLIVRRRGNNQVNAIIGKA